MITFTRLRNAIRGLQISHKTSISTILDLVYSASNHHHLSVASRFQSSGPLLSSTYIARSQASLLLSNHIQARNHCPGLIFGGISYFNQHTANDSPCANHFIAIGCCVTVNGA
jgi:hypothetical protein